MSSFGDIVKSIGTAPPPPPKLPSRPSSANTNKASANGGKPGLRSPLQQASSLLSGTKRKAEEEMVNVNSKAGKPNIASGPGHENRKEPASSLNAPKPHPTKVSVVPSKPSPTDGNAPPAAVAKPGPAKGSYAELMARAKEAREQRAQQQVGVIKHQDTIKQKPSKFAERRKQEQEQAKTQKRGNGKQARQQPSRSASPQKRDDSKDAKIAKSAPKPGYKGTMGIGAPRKKIHQGPAKKSKYDDYLGTDEEEDSDMDDDDQGGYDSEGSSDMEAGFDDVEVEESRALRQAQEDDAREKALENQLKKDKEERRKKLVALSAKRK